MERAPNNQGLMIVCDGGNGAGKSSVIRSIAAHLEARGHEVVLTREPGGTAIGERIRELLLSDSSMCDVTELMLFAAARAQHLREKILPAINAGKIVLSDRFDSATISFQHHGRGLPLGLIQQLNQIALDGFQPAINIILDLDPSVGLERVMSRGEGLDRLENEQLAFLQRAREGYLVQARNAPDRFKVIDASLPFEQVLAEAMRVVDTVVRRCMPQESDLL